MRAASVQRELRPMEVQQPISANPGRRDLNKEGDRSQAPTPWDVDDGALDSGSADRPVEHLLVGIAVEGVHKQAESACGGTRDEQQPPNRGRTSAAAAC